VQLVAHLNHLTEQFKPVSASAALDAQVLLARVMGKPRVWVLAHPEAQLTDAQQADLQADAARVAQGEPLPYVLGNWEFFGLEFEVNPSVLIPRPETELLVEEALGWAQRRGTLQVADVGTGSGCIAISLASRRRAVRVVASDISYPALQVAQRNARRHAVDQRLDLVQCHLLPSACNPFDLICANLPYIPEPTLRSLNVYRWEPDIALYGGPDGLSLLRTLLEQARSGLAPGGLLLLEIEASLGQAVLDLARTALPHARHRVLKDLAGLDRLVRVEN
jgi:release factor glutamine methyltransferase